MHNASPLPTSLRRHAWQLFIACLAEWRADVPAMHKLTVSAACVEGLDGSESDEYLTQLYNATVAHQTHITNGVTKHGRPQWTIINTYCFRSYNAADRSFTIVFNPHANAVLTYLQSVIDVLQTVEDEYISSVIHFELATHSSALQLELPPKVH